MQTQKKCITEKATFVNNGLEKYNIFYIALHMYKQLRLRFGIQCFVAELQHSWDVECNKFINPGVSVTFVQL